MIVSCYSLQLLLFFSFVLLLLVVREQLFTSWMSQWVRGVGMLYACERDKEREREKRGGCWLSIRTVDADVVVVVVSCACFCFVLSIFGLLLCACSLARCQLLLLFSLFWVCSRNFRLYFVFRYFFLDRSLVFLAISHTHTHTHTNKDTLCIRPGHMK